LTGYGVLVTGGGTGIGKACAAGPDFRPFTGLSAEQLLAKE